MTGSTTSHGARGRPGRTLVALVACGVVLPGGAAELLSDTAPTCDPRFTTATLMTPGAVPIDDAIWERHVSWDSQVHFRVGPSGRPEAIRVSIVTPNQGDESLAKATVDALSQYRFCVPAGIAGGTRWAANLRFDFKRVAARGVEMYAQIFVPSYTRDDLTEHRAGRLRVRATFGAEGRPTSVDVVSSSGDTVLDAKTVAALSTYQLVFRNGLTPKLPFVIEQPYTYQLH